MLNVVFKNFVDICSLLFHLLGHSNKDWFSDVQTFFFIYLLHILRLVRFFLILFLRFKILFRWLNSLRFSRLFVRRRWTWTCVLFLWRSFYLFFLNNVIFIVIIIVLTFRFRLFDFFNYFLCVLNRPFINRLFYNRLWNQINQRFILNSFNVLTFKE